MFWTVDQWVVTVKLDNRTERTVTVYDSCPSLPSLFTEYVANKITYGVQFEEEVKKIRAKREKRDIYLEKLQALVGTTIPETEPKTT